MDRIEERRTFERLKTEIPLQVCLSEGKVQGMTSDISGEGAAIIMTTQLQPQQELNLIFSVPNRSDTLSFRSSVIWIQEIAQHRWKAGVRLVNPNLFAVSSAISIQ